MPDDRVAAALKDIRGRYDLWAGWSHPDSGFVSLANAVEASAEDIPRLVAAVNAVLEIHRPVDGECGACMDAYGEPKEWPCEEYQDISAALLGEGAGGG